MSLAKAGYCAQKRPRANRKEAGFVEDLITNLLEIDQGAKARLEQARLQEKQILDALEDEATAASDEVLAEATAQVDPLMRESDARAKKRIEELQLRYQQAVAALDASYAEKKEQLVKAIVARCIGGE